MLRAAAAFFDRPLLRLGLAAPAFYNAALGVAAALFALALTLAANRVGPALCAGGAGRPPAQAA